MSPVGGKAVEEDVGRGIVGLASLANDAGHAGEEGEEIETGRLRERSHMEVPRALDLTANGLVKLLHRHIAIYLVLGKVSQPNHRAQNGPDENGQSLPGAPSLPG